MSSAKRKIIGYDDIEETAEAKRTRLEGYNYGTLNAGRVIADIEADEGFSGGEDLDDASEQDLPPKEETRPDERNGKSKGQSRNHGKKRAVRRADGGPVANVTTGMRAFLPGLDNDQEQSDEEDTQGAMAYLRAVRAEAQGIPGLLTAPDAGVRQDPPDFQEEEPVHGYYSDGAYIASTSIDYIEPPPSSGPSSAQDIFFELLKRRFLKLRTALKCPLGPGAVDSLPDDAPISFPNSSVASQAWARSLRARDPHPVQVACMDPHTVSRLLRICAGWLRRRRNIDRRLSAWMWCLLARLPDVGVMGSEDVGAVRDLGKRAVWVGLGWQDAAIAEATESQFVEGEGEEERHDSEGLTNSTVEPDTQATDDAGEDLLVNAKAALLGRLVSVSEPVAIAAVASPDANTTATLSAILTIAGELYGQRDLLEFRELW